MVSYGRNYWKDHIYCGMPLTQFLCNKNVHLPCTSLSRCKIFFNQIMSTCPSSDEFPFIFLFIFFFCILNQTLSAVYIHDKSYNTTYSSILFIQSKAGTPQPPSLMPIWGVKRAPPWYPRCQKLSHFNSSACGTCLLPAGEWPVIYTSM